jgi:AcrR family transcriptional regulator
MAAGLRERKKAAVRSALEQTALRLFLEKGYDHTTVEDITESVDVSTRTFFRYFATKDEVLFARQPERVAALRSFFAELSVDEPLTTTVPALVEHLAGAFSADADLVVVQVTVARQSRVPAGIIRLRQDELTEVVAEGIANRFGADPGYRPMIVATATLCAVELAVTDWFDAGQTGDMRDAIVGITAELLDTLAL